MFPKFFALGFVALTLAPVDAARDLQMPMKISCDIDFQSAGGLDPGTYFIFNVATDTSVRSYVANKPAVVSYANERPGPFGQWNAVKVGDGVFNISNKGLGLPTYIGDDGGVYSGTKGPALSFAIEPAEYGYFVVRSLDEDRVWTVEDVDAQRSPVTLARFNGDDAQLWDFRRN
ncbi:hypothetical protein B0H19DRAFT_1067791 [Mycena capillaripes]|nr:hypothetical protein B0H19DRAFT_1067791 [Mycena capillaripes]